MVTRLSIISLALAVVVLPQGANAQSAGRVVSVRGDVFYSQSGKAADASVAMRLGQQVHVGALIKTRAHSSVRVVMSDKSILALGPDTVLRLASYGRKRSNSTFRARLKLATGRIWARVSKWFGGGERRFEVQTTNAVAGVRGTEFVVTIDSNGGTHVWVVEGEVVMGSADVDLGTADDLQVVSGNQHGSVGNDGQVRVEDVTPDQVTEQVGSVGADGGSDDDDGSSGQPGQGSGGGEDGPDDSQDDGGDGNSDTEEDADPLGDAEIDDGIPPVELDPGSGNARVRGRVELRE